MKQALQFPEAVGEQDRVSMADFVILAALEYYRVEWVGDSGDSRFWLEPIEEDDAPH